MAIFNLKVLAIPKEVSIPVVIRDFHSSQADFESSINFETGLVAVQLNSQKIPIYQSGSTVTGRDLLNFKH